MCTFKEMQEAGLFEELGDVFNDDQTAASLIVRLDIKSKLQSFASMSPDQYWLYVGAQLHKGIIEDGIPKLVAAASELYPGNRALKELRERCKAAASHHKDPLDRARDGANFLVRLPQDLPVDLILQIAGPILEAARARGEDCTIQLVTRGSTNFHLYFEGLPPERQQEVHHQIEAELQRRGVAQAEVIAQPHRHPESMLDPIQIVGPDNQPFEATEIRSGTLVKEVIQMATTEYGDAAWPRTRDGAPRHGVLDVVQADGSHRRLDPTMTLLEAGVRPGDTLRFSPESTAGIDPVMREEALRRVRHQIDRVMDEHPDMEVETNAAELPTEYVLRFRGPGFAPPARAGEQPRPVGEHAVYLFLPPRFPVDAPQVFWQTPLFHPNVHPESGAVCLGELADRYKPGLDFRELVQLLMDIAGYRNYSVQEGFYDQAAAAWAHTAEGQAAIAGIGGRSFFKDLMRPGRGTRFKLRRVDP